MTSKLKTIVVFMLLSVLLTGCNNPLEESLKTRMQQMSEMADFGSVEYTVKRLLKQVMFNGTLLGIEKFFLHALLISRLELTSENFRMRM